MRSTTLAWIQEFILNFGITVLEVLIAPESKLDLMQSQICKVQEMPAGQKLILNTSTAKTLLYDECRLKIANMVSLKEMWRVNTCEHYHRCHHHRMHMDMCM